VLKIKDWKMKPLFFVAILYMDVSENSGTPKSSILIDLIGFSININHPTMGVPLFSETPIFMGEKC